jgi:uncharacterized membrane protein
VLAVVAVSQPLGLLLALLLIPLGGADPIPAGDAAIAFTGGMLAVGGLGVFYYAMAMGTISIVAPIAALGVVVPVVFGLARGEEPTAIQLAGLVLAIGGGVVLGYEDDPDHSKVTRKSVVLALVSALAFGTFFTMLDISAADRPGWTVVAARAGGVLVVALGLLIARPDLRGVPAVLPALLAMGALDILANLLFATASTRGLLPVIAVGGSMYPAFTVALAHVVLGERLRVSQRLGVILALGGVGLIAVGSA